MIATSKLQDWLSMVTEECNSGSIQLKTENITMKYDRMQDTLNIVENNVLFPTSKRPYFIISPPYTHISSGVRALHLLCHALNISGQRAYIVLQHDGPTHVNPVWLTPLLTDKIVEFYKSKELEPIVIYPDKIGGNPLNAKKVIRYLLAPAGLYGGPTDFTGEDVWSFLPGIAKVQGNDQVLRLPVSDTSIYYVPKAFSGHVRKGFCYYAHKYDKIHGNKLLPITDGMVRIDGEPEAIAELLRNSEALYAYENSQIIQEAQLCGCPVVLIKTDYFNEYLGKEGHISYGIRWHDEKDFITKSSSVAWHLDVLREYRAIEEEFWRQLDRFTKHTQK